MKCTKCNGVGYVVAPFSDADCELVPCVSCNDKGEIDNS